METTLWQQWKWPQERLDLNINVGIDTIQILNIVANGCCIAVLWITQSSIWQIAWSERNPPWCQSSTWPDCARRSPLLLLVGGKMSHPGNKVVWGTCRKIGWSWAACFTLTLFMTAYWDFPYPIYNLVCMINNIPAIFFELGAWHTAKTHAGLLPFSALDMHA